MICGVWETPTRRLKKFRPRWQPSSEKLGTEEAHEEAKQNICLSRQSHWRGLPWMEGNWRPPPQRLRHKYRGLLLLGAKPRRNGSALKRKKAQPQMRGAENRGLIGKERRTGGDMANITPQMFSRCVRFPWRPSSELGRKRQARET